MPKQYKTMTADSGISGCDAINKFLATNTEWRLWNVVASGTNTNMSVFILERDAPDGPKAPGPNGGSTEAALLTESTNVIPLKRAA